jgi:DNA-binding response OmpR family regulator
MDHKRSILIVDDDEVLRGVYTRRFAQTDLSIRTAANGQQAFDMIAQEVPELVICDVMMPDKDGWWLLEQFPKGSRTFRIVMLTNLDDVATKQKCMELGADGCLVKKDMSLRTLIETAEKLLDGAV